MAYTPESIELIPNTAKKYVVARYTPGLHHNRDGSVSIYIARRKPRGVPTAKTGCRSPTARSTWNAPVFYE